MVTVAVRGSPGDERDLAEVVAGAERVDDVAVLAHVGDPVDEHDELPAVRALGREGTARGEVDLVRERRHLCQLPLRQLLEQGHLLEKCSLRIHAGINAG